jgi:hypothetical protein
MVLVWSRNSLASREVSKELTLAMRNGLTVIPFRIENVQPTSEWDYHLANTHWMDAFPGELQTYVEELAVRIRGHLHEGSSSASLPEDYPKRAGTGTSRSTASTRKGVTTGFLVALGLALGVAAFWFLSTKSPGDSPSATDLPTANTAARERAALERSVQQAEMEKTKAQRDAAEREAEALREAAQRAEAEKQLALEKASRVEELARKTQESRQTLGFAGSQSQPNPGAGRLSPERGTIADPDGFTNIRRGPGTRVADGSEIPIVGRLVVGEVFDFFPDVSDWWLVRTPDGRQGFVHRSRIVAAGASNDSGPWLFPDSSVRVIGESELQRLSADQLWRARNEIFARRGYIFQSERGKEFVRRLGAVYTPLSADQNSVLTSMNAAERANVANIERIERATQP